jgi:alginate O-acetyltransferase complex protein AlgI
VERVVRDVRRRPPRDTPLRRALGRLVTFHVVCFGWIFFRADSFGRAGQVITQLFTAWGRPSPLVTSSVVLAILVGIGSQYLPRRGIAAVLEGFQRLPAVGQVATLAAGVMLVDTLGPPGVAPFIYFRF